MPLITPRTTRTKVVRHITQLYVENNEELHAYATFIGEPTAYVLNALIEKLLTDKDFREWRAKHAESFVPALGAVKRRTSASYQARTSAGRAGMVTLPKGA
jgi:hypothetical protein